MQNNDRKGKWQAFDALEGYKESLNQAKKEQEKKDKPILFSDEIQSLNEKLKEAYNLQSVINITYYNLGYLEHITGVVKKINLVNKDMLVITNDKSINIKFNAIIGIEERN